MIGKKFNTFIFILLSVTLFAQTKGYIRRNSFYIGEQTELVYELKDISSNARLDFYPHQKTIPCVSSRANLNSGKADARSLEIIGSFHDTLIQQGKTWIWQGSYIVTAWDTGKIVIPATSIAVKDSVYSFSPITLRVLAPKINAKQGIYDIKEVYANIPSSVGMFFRKNAWWMIAIVLLGLVVFWWLKKQKNKPKQAKQGKSLSLKEETLLEIDSLLAKKLWENEGLKEHYFQLSLIIRKYLGKRYHLSLIDKTSYQIQLLLVQSNVHKELVAQIKIVLEQSDLVKFAKSEPTLLEITSNANLAKEIVTKTTPYNEH